MRKYGKAQGRPEDILKKARFGQVRRWWRCQRHPYGSGGRNKDCRPIRFRAAHTAYIHILAQARTRGVSGRTTHVGGTICTKNPCWIQKNRKIRTQQLEDAIQRMDERNKTK